MSFLKAQPVLWLITSTLVNTIPNTVNNDMPTLGTGESSTSGERDAPTLDNSIASTQELTMPQDHSATVTFASDAPGTVSIERSSMRKFSSKLWYEPRMNETLMSFLARPYRVASGNISTSSGNITSFRPSVVLSNPTISQKIKGFLGMRATAKIKLLVNCSPFTQGLMSLVVYPTPDLLVQIPNRIAIPTLWTQAPRVDLDLSCETEATISVPYVSPYPYWNITDTKSEWFVCYLQQYVGMTVGTGAGTTPTYSLFMWFEDVEFCTPYQAQSGTSKIKKLGQEAEKEEGPVSKVASRVAKSATIMSRVPILSSFATTTAWAANLAREVASVWGYSKPRAVADVKRMVSVNDPYYHNFDGQSAALSLAGSIDHSVAIDPMVFGKDIDEMSLVYIASHFSYFNQVSIAIGTAKDTLLATHTLNPFIAPTNPSFPAVTGVYTTAPASTCAPGFIYYPTALGFVSTFFRAYHGSIKLRIRFIKTKFHSGRIRVNYIPGRDNGVTLTDQLAFYTQYLDLREASVFEITFPYINPLPFVTRNAVGQDGFGVVQFYLEDRLDAPSTAPSSITMLMESACGDDAVWAVPCRSSAFINITYGSGNVGMHTCRNTVPSYDSVRQYTYSAQSGAGCVVKKLDFDVNIKDANLDLSQYIVGESILSAKQLMSLPTVLPLDWNTSSPLWGTNFDPFHVFAVASNDGTNTRAAAPNVGEDTYSLFASAFAFAVGGVNLFFTNMTSNADANGYVQLAPGQASGGDTSVLQGNGGLSSTDGYSGTEFYASDVSVINVAFPNTARSFSVYVPSYVTLPCRSHNPGRSQPMYLGYNQTTVRFYTYYNSAADNRWLISRTIADDGRFGYFIGAPPLLLDTKQSS